MSVQTYQRCSIILNWPLKEFDNDSIPYITQSVAVNLTNLPNGTLIKGLIIDVDGNIIGVNAPGDESSAVGVLFENTFHASKLRVQNKYAAIVYGPVVLNRDCMQFVNDPDLLVTTLLANRNILVEPPSISPRITNWDPLLTQQQWCWQNGMEHCWQNTEMAEWQAGV